MDGGQTSQYDYFQANPWLAGLLGVTPIGSRYLAGIGAAEGWRQHQEQRKRLQQQMEVTEEAERRKREQEAAMEGLRPFYTMPDAQLAESRPPANLPLAGTKEFGGLQAEARKRLGIDVARRAMVAPGQPELEAEMGEVGTWPGAVRLPSQTVESPRGATVSIPRTSPWPTHLRPGEGPVVAMPPGPDQITGEPGEQWMSREPIERESVGQTAEVVAPPMGSRIKTQEARPPRLRSLVEALSAAEGPYAAHAVPVIHSFRESLEGDKSRTPDAVEVRRLAAEAHQAALSQVPDANAPEFRAAFARALHERGLPVEGRLGSGAGAKVTSPETVNQLQGLLAEEMEQFSKLPPQAQEQLRRPLAGFRTAVALAAQDPSLVNDAQTAYRNLESVNLRIQEMAQRQARFSEILAQRKLEFAEVKRRLDELFRTNDRAGLSSEINNLEDQVRTLQAQITAFQHDPNVDPGFIALLRQQAMSAGQLLRESQRKFGEKIREPRGAPTAAPPPGAAPTEAEPKKRRTIKTKSGKEVEVLD